MALAQQYAAAAPQRVAWRDLTLLREGEHQTRDEL